MTPPNTNWIVLGPGAISGLIAAGLLERDQSVSILSRSAEQNEIAWKVICSGTESHYNAPCVRFPLSENSIFVVAVKAFDVINALRQITELDGFQEAMPILLSHNGMVQLPDDLMTLNLHHMVTTHGAIKNRSDSSEIYIEHRGLGRSWLEVDQTHTESEIGLMLQQAFPPLTLEQDLTQRRWLKLIINCVINPLTAIHQCVNGELLNETWQSKIVNLIAEAVLVAESQNVSLKTEECYREVLRVAEETALNHSSMLQDIKQQRRTEIDQLTGYLVNTGELAGISTPTHHKLLDDFHQLYAR